MTGVQTCALPIFLDNPLPDAEPVNVALERRSFQAAPGRLGQARIKNDGIDAGNGFLPTESNPPCQLERDGGPRLRPIAPFNRSFRLAVYRDRILIPNCQRIRIGRNVIRNRLREPDPECARIPVQVGYGDVTPDILKVPIGDGRRF